MPADNSCKVRFVSSLHLLGIDTSSNFSLASSLSIESVGADANIRPRDDVGVVPYEA